MELYKDVSYVLSKTLTQRYSTSFGKSSSLFSKDIQPHIYAIYGLVRIADEVVDTYEGDDKAGILDALEQETYVSIVRGYSTNPIVHAFALTAAQFSISETLIKPFFESMRMDLAPQTYTTKKYEQYIYGSAEVIGLMCLRVFTGGDDEQYTKLEPGARALGAAYQKVNFLRDIASDFHDRGRVYFPGVSFETFDEETKEAIIKDITKDFEAAEPSVRTLPLSARKAVGLSFAYYTELLKTLEKTPAATLKTTRIRVPNSKKLALLVTQKVKRAGR